MCYHGAESGEGRQGRFVLRPPGGRMILCPSSQGCFLVNLHATRSQTREFPRAPLAYTLAPHMRLPGGLPNDRFEQAAPNPTGS